MINNNISSGSLSVSLRAPEPSDLDAMFLWENDATLWRLGWNCAPLSRKQISDYIDSYGDNDPFKSGQLRMMICAEGIDCPVGMIDLTDIDMRNRRAQVGVFVASPFRNKRVGRNALEKLREYSREYLDLHQLWAMTACGNDAAFNLFESAGYKTCGRLQSWLRHGRQFTDVLVHQKMLI